MAVGYDVPGIEEVNKSIRVGLTCALGGGCRGSGSVVMSRDPWDALRLCCRRGMAREVAKAYGVSLENGAPQLQQFFRLDWLLHRISCDEADAFLSIVYLFTQLFRKNILYLAASRKCCRAILRIEALRHQVATQDQHCCFISGET